MALYPYSRRLFRSRLLRVAALILGLWTCIEALYIHRTLATVKTEPERQPNTQKIFLASLPWNNEIIFRTHLSEQLFYLVQALGVHNIYLSIYENGSYDGTKDALRDLMVELDKLGVRNRLVLNDTSHEDVIKDRPTTPTEGWVHIDRPNFDQREIKTGDYALRRIPYLSELRNTVLKPLEDLAAEGERFDKILFLTDVVFSTDDILNLLDTRGGEYAAACTLDFQTPPEFYDTFAMRDSDGLPAIMKTWPYFRSAASRNALLANEPVPVRSCWNGIVAMPAAPFYSVPNPLRFRGVADSLAQKHVEGSECCLIHADNELSSELGVWINPKVRVGYCHGDLGKGLITANWDAYRWACSTAYDQVNPSHGAWLGYFRIAWGLWENRLRRLMSFGSIPDWKAKRRLREWRREDQEHWEPGGMCLIDEMQVIEPRGWMHV